MSQSPTTLSTTDLAALKVVANYATLKLLERIAPMIADPTCDECDGQSMCPSCLFAADADAAYARSHLRSPRKVTSRSVRALVG